MRTSHHKLQNFRPNAALQTQNSAQMFSFFPVLHAAKTHCPNALPSHRPIFTRNEREQPENLQSSKFIFPPPVLIIHVVPLNTPQIFPLCLVFSLLKVNYDLIRYISIHDWLAQCMSFVVHTYLHRWQLYVQNCVAWGTKIQLKITILTRHKSNTRILKRNPNTWRYHVITCLGYPNSTGLDPYAALVMGKFLFDLQQN